MLRPIPSVNPATEARLRAEWVREDRYRKLMHRRRSECLRRMGLRLHLVGSAVRPVSDAVR